MDYQAAQPRGDCASNESPPSYEGTNENRILNSNENPISDRNLNGQDPKLPVHSTDHTSQLEVESAVKVRTTSRRSTFQVGQVSPDEQTEIPQESSRKMIDNGIPTKRKTVSLAGTIFTMLQSTLGAGTITLPYAIYANGLILGPLLMIGAALLSYYTGYLLARVGALQNKYSFREIAISLYGKKFAKFINILIALDLMGVATAYLILLKNLIPHMISGIAGDTQLPGWLLSPVFWLSVVSVSLEQQSQYVVIFPLLLMRTVHSLQFTSYVGFASIIYLLLLVIVQFVINCDQKVQNLRNATLIKVNFKGILTSYPMIFFAYFYQTLIPSAQYELRNRSLRKMKISLGAFLTIGTMVYIVFSIFGYLSFVHSPQQLEKKNILQVTDYASRIECQIAFVFFIFVIITATAINFKPVKDSFTELIFKNATLTRRANFGMTLVLLSLCYLLALAVPMISDAIQVKSCTTSPIIFMIVPILLHFKVDGLSRCAWRRMLPYGIIILMGVASVLGFVAFLLEKLDLLV